MADISKIHKPDLVHHIKQGISWLSESAEGENTATLSYAAFEFRFAVERLAIQYWMLLLERKPEEQDLHNIKSFKRVERCIYALAGHQKEIDSHFEFMRIVIESMNIKIPFHTPNIGVLSNYWHTCSELCHIAWPLTSSRAEVRKNAFTVLTEIGESLKTHTQSLGWPILKEPEFIALRDKFLVGEAAPDDVLAFVKNTGMWAHVEYPDGSPSEFVGDAIPPDKQTE